VLLSVLGLTMPIHDYLESPPTILTQYREFRIALPALSNPPTMLLCLARYLPPFTGCLSVRQRVTFKFAGLIIVACMKPLLPIYHLSFVLILQHDHFNLLLHTFLLNPVSELHLLLVASNLPDHEFSAGTLYQMTSNLLPLSLCSDQNSKLTSLLQLVNNWPLSELCASDSTSYSILRML